MNAKKWIVVNLSTVFTVVAMFLGFNYIIDPYGLNNFIHIDRINAKKISNAKITTRYQLYTLGKGNFDTLLLGSSRVGVMDPEVANKYLGGNTFSLGQPRSTASVQYDMLRYATHFNPIKNVIYGIDFIAFNKNNMINTEYLDMEDKIKEKEREWNFDLYFSFDTFLKSAKLVKNNFLGKEVNSKKEPAVYLPHNGMRKHVGYIEDLKNGKLELDKEIQKHLEHYFGEKKNDLYYNYTFSKEYLIYFKKIIQYCKNNHIKLWVYMPPMLAEHFDAIYAAGYFDEYEQYEREVAQITDFVDFTGHNTITDNKNNYWDSSHLREELTPFVMAKIFNDPTVNVPEDFGIFVTKENIEQHLKELEQKIQPYDITPLLEKKNK